MTTHQPQLLQPICQAKDCSTFATETIPSRHGHPTPVWSLCRAHFNAVEGQDPWNIREKGWTLQKLHYRCVECGHIVSHNTVTTLTDCHRCG